jgi:hypothetical protein
MMGNGIGLTLVGDGSTFLYDVSCRARRKSSLPED